MRYVNKQGKQTRTTSGYIIQ